MIKYINAALKDRSRGGDGRFGLSRCLGESIIYIKWGNMDKETHGEGERTGTKHHLPARAAPMKGQGGGKLFTPTRCALALAHSQLIISQFTTPGSVSRQLHYTTRPEQPDLGIFFPAGQYVFMFECVRRKGGVSLQTGGIHNDRAIIHVMPQRCDQCVSVCSCMCSL